MTNADRQPRVATGSVVPVASLHPLTRKSIETHAENSSNHGVPACGCESQFNGALMRLCGYHDGFDVGATAAEGRRGHDER